MSDDASSPRFGFTWGRTDDVSWLADGDGNYKKIEQSFLRTLRDLATGAIDVEDLSEEERAAYDHLAEEGFIDPAGDLRHEPSPDGVTLWPRVAAFAVAFLALTGLVAARYVLPGPIATRGDGFVNALVLWLSAIPLFLGLAVVHEAGHYAASRPYFEPSFDFTLLNGVFPSIVTNTNDAWRCPRSVRIWISLAGPFVDCLATICLALASLFVFPNARLLSLATVFEYVRILFALNPLLRGDGYWILVDWFGTVNLYTRGLGDLRDRTLSGPAAYAVGSIAFTGAILVLVGYVVVTSLVPL